MAYLITFAVALVGFFTAIGLPGNVPAILVGGGLISIGVGAADAKQIVDLDAYGGAAFVVALAVFGIGFFAGHQTREWYEKQS
jgi:hypothetical protein